LKNLLKTAAVTDAGDVDARLLERWRSGDRGAGAELYRRHARVVIRFFRTKVEADFVEDRVQETFTRLAEARGRIQDTGACRAYLLQIARYVLLEHLRSRARERELDPAVDTVAAESPGLTTALGRKREHRLLLTALRRLPIEQQIRLELRYFEGISIVELAQLEGVTPSTMRGRMSRARVLLTRAIRALDESTALINSTVEGLDAWARDVRALLADPDEQ
jgi:RNA polymerase sigma-70 factor (ECF subfamily)